MRRAVFGLLALFGCDSAPAVGLQGRDASVGLDRVIPDLGDPIRDAEPSDFGFRDSGPGDACCADSTPSIVRVIGSIDFVGAIGSGPAQTQDLAIDRWDALIESANGPFVVPGQNTRPGEVSFFNVPEGPRIIAQRIGADFSLFYATQAPLVDLSYAVFGNITGEYAFNFTPLCFNTPNQPPWTEGDSLDLVSLSAGAVVPSFEELLDRPMLIDEVGLNFRCIDYSEAIETMITSQDDATVYLRRSLDTGGARASTIRWALDARGLDMIDGNRSVIEGRFAEVIPNQSFQMVGGARSFIDIAPRVHPRAVPGSMIVEISALPAADRFGSYDNGPILMQLRDIPEPFQRYSVNYADPFDPALTRFYTVEMDYTFAVTAPGAIRPAQLRTSIGWSDVYGPMQIVDTIVLEIEPPVNLTINGNIAADRAPPPPLPDLTPILDWQAPGRTPEGYDVTVRRLEVTDTGDTVARFVTFIYADAPPLRIPEGVLEIGQSYVFEVTSLSRPGPGIGAEPYRSSFPLRWAGTFSSPYTPQ